MASTLGAADIAGVYQGYYLGLGGTLSPDTFGAFTCTAIITGYTPGSVLMYLSGDATAFLAGQSIVINGTTYSTITSGPTFDGSGTTIEWAYGPGNFTVGNSYSIDIGGGGPASPNITSAATIYNALGTVLAHTVTADKTIASMAITGGADAADFEVYGTSGLRFAGNAVSSAAGSYVVDVTITDTDGLTDTQTITVVVEVPYEGPTWVGKSSAAGSASATSINYSSSGRTADDLLLTLIETANQAIATPSGFTEVPTHSPQSIGTAAAAGGVRGAAFTKDSDGTEGTVSIADSGNHQYAVGAVFRGVDGALVEIHASNGSTSSASTSGSFGGVTTTVDNCLIVTIAYTDRDSTAASWSNEDNASLKNLTKRHDAGTTSGAGGGIAIFTGEKQAAGATGTITADHAANVPYAWITLALKNVDAGGDVSAPIGTAAETDSASALGRSQRLTLGSAGETDSAAALSGYQARAIGAAGETDSAGTLTGAQRVTLGIATETDSAAAFAVGGTPIGVASESDSAAALAGSQRLALGVAAEADTAAALIGAQRLAIGPAAETDSAAAQVGAQVAAIGAAGETDSAGAATGSQRRAIGAASESDTASTLSGAQRAGVGAAPESDTATAQTASAVAALGVADETDSALPMRAASGIGVAIESDSAAPLVGTQVVPIGVAAETDSAAVLVLAVSAPLGVASESDSALPMVAASEIYVPRRTVRHSGTTRVSRAPEVPAAGRGEQVSTAARGSRARPGGPGGRPAAISRGSR